VSGYIYTGLREIPRAGLVVVEWLDPGGFLSVAAQGGNLHQTQVGWSREDGMFDREDEDTSRFEDGMLLLD